MKQIGMQGYKIDPWLKFADDDTFLLDMDKVLTISEVRDADTLEMYLKFVKQHNQKKTAKMSADGPVSTVAEARIRFEKLYNSKET